MLPLPPRYRFRDLLLGDQSFQSDDRFGAHRGDSGVEGAGTATRREGHTDLGRCPGMGNTHLGWGAHTWGGGTHLGHPRSPSRVGGDAELSAVPDPARLRALRGADSGARPGRLRGTGSVRSLRELGCAGGSVLGPLGCAGVQGMEATGASESGTGNIWALQGAGCAGSCGCAGPALAELCGQLAEPWSPIRGWRAGEGTNVRERSGMVR